MKTILFSLLFALSLQATTVASVTCTGSTVTVNATAHGLADVQGFLLSGTAPQFDGTVGLNHTTNAFTFALPSWATCASFTSGYSTVVPAQQILQIAGTASPSNGTVNEQVLMEFTTLYPNPLKCSVASTLASMVVASNVGTITTGTTTSYTVGQSISLVGSGIGVAGAYTVASVIWPNQLTVTTSGVSNGTYPGLTLTSGTACPQSVYPNASAALNAAIVAGTTVEYYAPANYPANASGPTIQAAYITQYNTMQAGFTGGLLAGTGYCFNGTGTTFTTNCVN